MLGVVSVKHTSIELLLAACSCILWSKFPLIMVLRFSTSAFKRRYSATFFNPSLNFNECHFITCSLFRLSCNFWDSFVNSTSNFCFWLWISLRNYMWSVNTKNLADRELYLLLDFLNVVLIIIGCLLSTFTCFFCGVNFEFDVRNLLVKFFVLLILYFNA